MSETRDGQGGQPKPAFVEKQAKITVAANF